MGIEYSRNLPRESIRKDLASDSAKNHRCCRRGQIIFKSCFNGSAASMAAMERNWSLPIPGRYR
jgi:hypothetical protein